MIAREERGHVGHRVSERFGKPASDRDGRQVIRLRLRRRMRCSVCKAASERAAPDGGSGRLTANDTHANPQQRDIPHTPTPFASSFALFAPRSHGFPSFSRRNRGLSLPGPGGEVKLSGRIGSDNGRDASAAAAGLSVK
jgi:hypothetical protein